MSARDVGASPELLALIARALPSMVHVELLLLLERTAPAAWSVAAASEELRGSPGLVGDAMAELVRARLAAPVLETSPPEWRLDVSDAASLTATALLRELYERRPVTLVRALYGSSDTPSRDDPRHRPPSE